MVNDVNDHFCMLFRGVRSAQQAEIARFGQTSIGSPEHSVLSASSRTTPTHAAPRVPFLQRRIAAAALLSAPFLQPMNAAKLST